MSIEEIERLKRELAEEQEFNHWLVNEMWFDQFRFCWTEYAIADPTKLTLGAQVLRQRMRDVVGLDTLTAERDKYKSLWLSGGPNKDLQTLADERGIALAEVTAERDALKARVKELEAALRPFADCVSVVESANKRRWVDAGEPPDLEHFFKAWHSLNKEAKPDAN